MPEFQLAADDARDIAAYILTTPLAPPAPRPVPPRLPLLERPVKFDEVSEKVFRRTCWHCHGEPDYAAGDGGPGNTGGLGFKPRGINFVDYGSVLAGERSTTRASGQPVREGGGRHAADRAGAARAAGRGGGHPDPEVRGMPLGYPPLTAEEIQLVESWMAQGRPR